MEDSFTTDNKKYISARRAAEISEYSADYIGQLCRGGKLDCMKRGNTWFVTRESLVAHQAVVITNELSRNRIDNLKSKKSEIASSYKALAKFADAATVAEQDSTVIDGRKFVSAKAMSQATGYSQDYIGQMCRAEKLECRMIGRSWYVSEQSAFPATAPIASLAPLAAAVSNANSVAPIVSKPTSRQSFFVEKVLATMIVVAVAVGAAVSALYIVDGRGGSGSVQGAAAFGTMSSDGKGRDGMVITDSSAVTDEATKAGIRSSFSDSVVVQPDKSGAAGVITPVFKDAKTKDFVYVMVPVKDKNK